MISIIIYIIHYYVVPRKVYYDLESFTRGIMSWERTFETVNALDVALSAAILMVTILELLGVFDKILKTSSKEKEL